MITIIEAGRSFVVEATDPRLIEEELNKAEDEAIQHAIKEGRHGVLVTRTGYATFTVTVSDKVPYGITMEEDALPKN